MRILFHITMVLGLLVSVTPWFKADNRAAVPVSSKGAPTEHSTNHIAVSFKLKSNAIAPAHAEASGEFRAGALTLCLRNLGPGRYEMAAVCWPDAVIKKLGTIIIIDPTLSPDRQADDNKKEASANPDQVYLKTEVTITPVGVSPQQITRLVLADAGGNAVFFADSD